MACRFVPSFQFMAGWCPAFSQVLGSQRNQHSDFGQYSHFLPWDAWLGSLFHWEGCPHLSTKVPPPFFLPLPSQVLPTH